MEPLVNRIKRGYAGSAVQETRLRELGIKTIYRGHKGETVDRFRMREGELLGVVNGLLAFGEAKRDMVAAVKAIHAKGAVIVDAETGLRSDRDGVEMLSVALAPKRPSDAYRAAQAKGVANRTKGRMPAREAAIIWRDPRFTVKEAIDLMYKWTQATAYKQLGKRFVPAGRRPK